MTRVIDPLEFGRMCWPDVKFYREQTEVIYSVRDNVKTFVPAGNMLGKDFVAAFIALWFFVSRHPCRVVTTSVDGTQLESVLWGEIRRFLQTTKYELPILVNHLHLRKIVGGKVDGLSYMIGRVAAKGEGMLGHHVANVGDEVPRTLFIADEASGVDDTSHDRADTWAARMLAIGNTYPCTNFFRQGVIRGDVPMGENGKPHKGKYFSRVIKIKAEQSPNVRLGLAQRAKGLEPTDEVVIPGVLSYGEYLKRRTLWDQVRQCIGLDAEFYEGAEELLYPPLWLNLAEEYARTLGSTKRGEAMGLDSAQGGDNTSWAIVNSAGLIHLESRKTPDTSTITSRTIALAHEYGVRPERIYADAGGGGKQHADRLRQQGFDVKLIAFGGAPTPPRKRSITTFGERVEADEVRATYVNRRAELYGILREALEPMLVQGDRYVGRFALPSALINCPRPDGGPSLRGQLSIIPRTLDQEGRLRLLPKTRRDAQDKRLCLTDLIGCSPDEADALALAVFGLKHRVVIPRAG